MAGSAAALALARSGHEAHLYEAVAQPEPIGAGLLLQPTGLEVLRRLGLADAMLALGARVESLYGDTPTGRRVLDMGYARLSKGSAATAAFGVGVQRGALMGVLWQALRASAVQWHCGTAVSGFEPGPGGVTLQQQGPAAVPGRFDLLLLANGSFSRLRQHMRVRQSERLFPWGALWCLLPEAAAPADWPAATLRQRYRQASEMIGVMPVGSAFGSQGQAASERRVTLFWSQRAADLQAWTASPDLTTLKRAMAALLPAAQPLLDALTDPAQLRVARYADVWMQQWHDGPVLAIGDCGHGMSPQLGQGANMGLIDAWVLAQAVDEAAAAAAPWPTAAAAYTRQRRAHIRFYQQASRALTPLFQSHRTAGPWLRDLFFGFSAKLPFIESQSVQTLCGVKAGWLSGRLRF